MRPFPIHAAMLLTPEWRHFISCDDNVLCVVVHEVDLVSTMRRAVWVTMCFALRLF